MDLPKITRAQRVDRAVLTEKPPIVVGVKCVRCSRRGCRIDLCTTENGPIGVCAKCRRGYDVEALRTVQNEAGEVEGLARREHRKYG